MKELLIKIVSLFKGDGVKQAIDETAKLGKEAKEAGTTMDGFGARMRACVKDTGMLAGAVSAAGSALISFGVNMAMGLVQGVGNAARAMVHGVKEISDFAAQMSNLSDRTGQTVNDVIVLGQVFRNAGMGSEMVGASLNLLQKALTGVNEQGQPTANAFRVLGLSISDLSKMSATAQLQAIGSAIGKIKDPAVQTRLAIELFGQSGGKMLAVLKDASAFDTARTQIGQLAENLSASAEDLEKFSRSVDALDVKKMQFFAGFSAGISGDLASAADAMDRMDFSAPGKALGEAAAGASEMAKSFDEVAASLVKAAPTLASLAVLLTKQAVRTIPGGEAALGAVKGFVWLQEKGQDANRERRLQKNLQAAKDGAEAAKNKEPEPLGPEYGPGGNAEDRVKAQEAADKARKLAEQLGAKRAELDLELRIAEARAAGDKSLETRLVWMRDYNRLLEQAQAAEMEDPWGYARRGANAAMGKDKKSPGESPVGIFDNGNVQAGSQRAAMAAAASRALAARPPEDSGKKTAENTGKLLRKTDALIKAVEKFAEGAFV